jgi:hypothetical protein
MFINFFPENGAVCEIMSKNMLGDKIYRVPAVVISYVYGASYKSCTIFVIIDNANTLSSVKLNWFYG